MNKGPEGPFVSGAGTHSGTDHGARLASRKATVVTLDTGNRKRSP
jgi:hypothetical protein